MHLVQLILQNLDLFANRLFTVSFFIDTLLRSCCFLLYLVRFQILVDGLFHSLRPLRECVCSQNLIFFFIGIDHLVRQCSGHFPKRVPLLYVVAGNHPHWRILKAVGKSCPDIFKMLRGLLLRQVFRILPPAQSDFYFFCRYLDCFNVDAAFGSDLYIPLGADCFDGSSDTDWIEIILPHVFPRFIFLQHKKRNGLAGFRGRLSNLFKIIALKIQIDSGDNHNIVIRDNNHNCFPPLYSRESFSSFVQTFFSMNTNTIISTRQS